MTMRSRPLLLPLATSALALSLGSTRGDAPRTQPGWTEQLPPLEAPYPLPPLPETSARNASYTIEARLDPGKHTIDGTLVLEWRNTGTVAVDNFPFHLYWNAFRNNLSTSARGEGRRAARAREGAEAIRGFGYTHVRSVRLLGATDPLTKDLTPTLRYVQPDDGNADDRTLMEVRAPAAVKPGDTARFRVEWTSQIPYGDVGRAGWVHDYHFVAQWFPKIGVLVGDHWNAHQFHPWSEFFSDFGVYDVALTLPEGFVVGATGRLEQKRANADGTETFRFRQEDVHDFTWTASRRYQERTDRFEAPGYPPVAIRLLYQPEHAHLAERYVEATRIALRAYGAWGAPYPYPQITVVDPAWNSASGGMEYPTLFTGGANVWAPAEMQSPEGVTIHEAGHQFWYGLVANNEFEEAWLDEGFNSYHDEKSAQLALGPRAWGRRYFGVQSPRRGSRGGVPVTAPGIWIGRGEGEVSGLRTTGETDPMARRSWEYRTSASYGLNSYGKPALSLQTLEALVGDETMTRILRTYARRFRFRHPTSADFIATVNEVTGKDYRWFFDETWYSSSLCDYAIGVENERPRKALGYVDSPKGEPELAARHVEQERDGDAGPWESVVTVLRKGEVRMPVEIRVETSDGRVIEEAWDGRERWMRFRYSGDAKVRRAVVDPERKLAIDVDPTNNSWVEDEGRARRAATKWSARFLFWLQNLLELHTVLG
jgi:hypothetical protein